MATKICKCTQQVLLEQNISIGLKTIFRKKTAQKLIPLYFSVSCWRMLTTSDKAPFNACFAIHLVSKISDVAPALRCCNASCTATALRLTSCKAPFQQLGKIFRGRCDAGRTRSLPTPATELRDMVSTTADLGKKTKRSCQQP